MFVGTRVSVQSLFDYLEGGETLDEFLRQFPSGPRGLARAQQDYPVLPDEDAERDGDLRVIDESGEDYLFSADRFVAIESTRARQGQPAKGFAGLTRPRLQKVSTTEVPEYTWGMERTQSMLRVSQSTGCDHNSHAVS